MLGGVSTALVLSLMAEGGFDARSRAGREAGRGGRCSDTSPWVLRAAGLAPGGAALGSPSLVVRSVACPHMECGSQAPARQGVKPASERSRLTCQRAFP